MPPGQSHKLFYLGQDSSACEQTDGTFTMIAGVNMQSLVLEIVRTAMDIYYVGSTKDSAS